MRLKYYEPAAGITANDMKLSPVRLMLVDDHALVRMGLSALLQVEPGFEVVAEAEDAESARVSFRKHLPDITLMDLRMPGKSGVDATREILREFPEAKIVMLTTYDTEEEIHQAIEAGACGYLLKNITREELVNAIRQVHAGEACIPESVARRLADRRSSPQLTPREMEVLEFVTKGLNNREIAQVLDISGNTVKAHLKHVFSKLDVSDRAEAAVAAIQRGILGVS